MRRLVEVWRAREAARVPWRAEVLEWMSADLERVREGLRRQRTRRAES